MGNWILGYNTNGLPHHRVHEALQLCAELGYEAVAITPDAGLLDPYELDADAVARVRRTAEELGLTLTVETGSRFLLDAARKHFPTLLEEAAEDRARRPTRCPSRDGVAWSGARGARGRSSTRRGRARRSWRRS